MCRKQGFAKALLDVATVLGGTRLSVRRKNQKAIHIYEKYGFKIVDENDEVYFMKLEE